MAKRANGEGTIRKRPDGRWEGRYIDPVTNKQHSVYAKTQKEVREKLSAVATDKDSGMFISRDSITVNEWFDIFIETYKRGVIKPQSVSAIISKYQKYIKPVIGHIPIQDVTQHEIKKILTKAQVQQLSSSTLNSIRVYMNDMFDKALKQRVIKINPVQNIKTPQSFSPEEENMRELTNFELYWFFRGLIEHKPMELLYFALLYSTGARRGEISSLRWKDISEDFSYISIKTTYVQYWDCEKDENQKIVNTPKTEKSNRLIPLLPEIQVQIRNKKEAAQFIAEQFGRKLTQSDFVFVKAKTNTIFSTGHYNSIITTVRAYLLREYNIDLEDFSPHCLRHTFTSQAIRNNVPLEVLKQLLGHSSYKMISKTYAHCSYDDKTIAISSMFLPNTQTQQAINGNVHQTPLGSN